MKHDEVIIFVLHVKNYIFCREHGLTTLYRTGWAVALSPFRLGVMALDVSHSHGCSSLHFSSYVLSPEIYILSVAQSLS